MKFLLQILGFLFVLSFAFTMLSSFLVNLKNKISLLSINEFINAAIYSFSIGFLVAFCTENTLIISIGALIGLLIGLHKTVAYCKHEFLLKQIILASLGSGIFYLLGSLMGDGVWLVSGFIFGALLGLKAAIWGRENKIF